MRVLGVIIIVSGAFLTLAPVVFPEQFSASATLLIFLGIMLIVAGALAFSRLGILRDGSPVLRLVDEEVDRHRSALLAEKARRIYVSPYGIENARNWDREVSEFCDQVVVPSLHARLGAAVLHREERAAVKLLARRAGVPVSRIAMRPDESLRACVCWWIDQKVREYEVAAADESASPPPHFASALDFEKWCARSLQNAGWESKLCGGPGDQGVDIVARKEGATAVLQCKLSYSGPVGNSAAQEIHLGRLFYRAQLAVVVSNAQFTKGARIAARQAGVLLLHHTQLRLLQLDGTLDSAPLPRFVRSKVGGAFRAASPVPVRLKVPDNPRGNAPRRRKKTSGSSGAAVLVVVVLLLAGRTCVSDNSSSPVAATDSGAAALRPATRSYTPLSQPIEVHFRELPSYTISGRLFRNVLVAPDTQTKDLVAFAQAIHAESPRARVNFFDSDDRFEEIRVALASAGRRRAPHDVNRWLGAHDIASIAEPSTGTGKCVLIGGPAGRYGQVGAVIADLDSSHPADPEPGHRSL